MKVVVQSLDDIARIIARLQEQIDSLRSERRAASTTIGDGNLVIDGGDVVMLDTDGSVMFRLGDQVNGDRGLFMARDDGSLAFAVRKTFAGPGAQSIEVRSREGYLLLAEEALGTGLSRPYLHLPLHPVMATPTTLQHGPYGPEVPVTAATFTTTHRAWIVRHNQYGRFMMQIAASDATTSAEVQVINAGNGDVLGDFFAGPWLGTRAVGSTGYVQVDPPRIYLPGVSEDRVSVAVQVRRSAGTGTLRVAVPESHGA